MKREAAFAGLAALALLGVVARVASGPRATELYEFSSDEHEFAKLHPVYTRCAKKVDMPAFSDEIQKKCGDVHELKEVAAPCHNAMQMAADRFGCCWETVMDGYKTLDPEAHHAWRMWQGTLSGKAGVTFSDDDCGEAMGEKGYEGLKDQVSDLENIVSNQAWEIQKLQYPEYFGYYKGQTSPQLAARQKTQQRLANLPAKGAKPQRRDIVV